MSTFKPYQNLTQPHIKTKLYGWDDGKFDADDLQQLKQKWEELIYRTHGQAGIHSENES